MVLIIIFHVTKLARFVKKACHETQRLRRNFPARPRSSYNSLWLNFGSSLAEIEELASHERVTHAALKPAVLPER